MQIDALRDTTKLMKNFTKTNKIEKIEQLTDTMSELQDNIMDINEQLTIDVIDFNDDELEHELAELNSGLETNIIATFPIVPQNDITSSDNKEEQILLSDF